eukprot:m.232680 g.232680  ORF g.232680 m.232680 type:complete len:155 (+) comp40082_c0_seq7:1364-1828(+)
MYQYLARNWVVLEGPVIKGNFAVLVWTGDGATEPVELSRSTLRRYSEFERLDKMLKSGPLAPLLKGVQLPGKRLFGSLNPFGKSDDEFLSRRKVHLEAYLHILLSKPAVRNAFLLLPQILLFRSLEGGSVQIQLLQDCKQCLEFLQKPKKASLL